MIMRLPITLLTVTLSCYTAMATTVIANGWVWNGSAEETQEHDEEFSALPNNSNLRLRGISSPEPQKEAMQPQQHVSNNHLLKQTFVHNMLENQGCTPTSSCGDVCYVLTIAAAADLHSVAAGKSNRAKHHWHNPESFWRLGVCDADKRCESVNPYDKKHDFKALEDTLSDVEGQCGRKISAATRLLLVKAMDAAGCDHSVAGASYPNALVQRDPDAL